MPDGSQSGTPPRRRGPGLVRVRGRSMFPALRDGDLLLVRWGARPVLGRVAVVRLPGGRPLSVKRVTARGDDGWWVERDNPADGVDSWLVGALADDDVVALVRCRVWPHPGRVAPSSRP